MSVDPFSTFDAAYVLGALSAEDRSAYEAHLRTCESCAESVASLRHMPALLAAVPESAYEPTAEVEPPPDTLLPRLLRETRRSRHRRYWLTGSIAAAVAAGIIATTATLATSDSGTTPPTAGRAVAMAKVVPAPVRAKADVVETSTGSRIDIWCTYDASEYSSADYALVIHSRTGADQTLATWRGVPDQTMVLHAPTTWARPDIASVDITSASGAPLLRLTR